MKVVLIDGNLMMSSKVSSILRGLGIEVEKALGWNRIEELLSKGNFSAVFINLEASPSALNLIKRIKENSPEVKVIGYCGHKNVELQRSALSSGADLVVSNGQMVSDPRSVLREALRFEP